VWFEFKIQTPFFNFKPSHIDTCIITPKSCIEEFPTKVTFVKIKSREIFSEFTRFFPQGLNAFKIQGRFKFESVPKFIT
jgi:hypothetical protein